MIAIVQCLYFAHHRLLASFPGLSHFSVCVDNNTQIQKKCENGEGLGEFIM